MPPPFMLIIMAVYRAKKKDTQPKKDAVTAHTPVSNESMERLARIMNDSPSIMKLHGTEWCIKGLKPGVQWLIAEQACRIVKGEKLSMGDVIKEFAVNLPAVAHVITLALLNDKDRIFSDYEKKELSDDYHKVYDLLMWGEYDIKDWALLLGEILNLISTDFFFESINVIQTVREMTLARKMKKTEQRLTRSLRHTKEKISNTKSMSHYTSVLMTALLSRTRKHSSLHVILM